MALYGKVLKIFDEMTLLVNIGSREGLHRGSLIAIVEKGEEIKDNDTGESMGELELIKKELVVRDAQERMSLCRVERESPGADNLPLSARMVRDSVKADDSQYRLNVRAGEISGLPSTSPVKTGDLVRVIG
ncbi:MAG: hypothetical protein JXB45_00765 [Candidatus Krumholzibacteriota bacterium]|nr:hypothetical protein [Candidatus Krumholzibacteriota bacterium]